MQPQQQLIIHFQYCCSSPISFLLPPSPLSPLPDLCYYSLSPLLPPQSTTLSSGFFQISANVSITLNCSRASPVQKLEGGTVCGYQFIKIDG